MSKKNARLELLQKLSRQASATTTANAMPVASAPIGNDLNGALVMAVNPLTTEEAEVAGLLRRVPLDKVHFDPNQPRQTIDNEAISELAATIEATGRVIQPPVLRAHPTKAGEWLVVVGERRTRAMRRLGWREGEFIIQEMDDRTAVIVQLVENSEKARQQVRPLEEAAAMSRLVNMLESQQAVADALGMSKSYVSKRIELLSLPAEVRELLTSEKLKDYETAVNLAKLKTVAPEIYAGVVSEAQAGLPVKRAVVISALKTAKSGPARPKSPPGEEVLKKVAEDKARLVRACEDLGVADAGKIELSVEQEPSRDGRHKVRLSVRFDSWTAAHDLIELVARRSKD